MARLICLLGNALEPTDALPVALFSALERNFPNDLVMPYDPTEEFPDGTFGQIILIDTVVGLAAITRFTSVEEFALSPRVTVHDYDLPLTLGLLKKLGKLPQVIIIGIPAGYTGGDPCGEVVAMLQSS